MQFKSIYWHFVAFKSQNMISFDGQIKKKKKTNKSRALRMNMNEMDRMRERRK